MSDSACFEFACEVLENATSLDRLEARGTIRLVLKDAGLDARTVTPDQMGVVAEKLLPAQLESRGVENSAGVCRNLEERLRGMEAAPAASNAPEAVFARLGGA